MPNHCYQTVSIYGPRAMVTELYFNLDSDGVDPRFCDTVIPMPLDQAGNSYEWRNENWGTKWDVKEVSITFALQHSDMDPPAPVAGMSWFKFKCWTAYAPPRPVWDKLYAMGIEVWAKYEDEGLNFSGAYMFGEDKLWRPTALDDERLLPVEETA